MNDRVKFSVFTKPWKTVSLARLGKLVSALGFDGVELPVRPGYQVEPEDVEQLSAAARELGQFGVKIFSVAGPADERTVAACGEAGVPIIRRSAHVGPDESYLAAEARIQSEYDALLPALDRHGVKLGIQNHSGRCVSNALGLLHLIEKYDPEHVAAVWDAAHEALAGGLPDLALDVIWPRLCMVNLKSAYWLRTNGPEAEHSEWTRFWTTGRHGRADWPAVAQQLVERGLDSVICLTAEYSDEEAVERLIAEDIAFAKSLFS